KQRMEACYLGRIGINIVGFDDIVLTGDYDHYDFQYFYDFRRIPAGKCLANEKNFKFFTTNDSNQMV
ncbi:hypothetical protein L0Z72_06450, partial [candidate division KSB1 bacterium]|nr:hypothetical protein [candidate division KSB1 bacterium]